MDRIKNLVIYIISFALVVSMVSSIQAVSVFADTQVQGVVSAIKGSAYVKRQGSEKKTAVYKNMTVSQGDTLITGEKSSLTIKVKTKEIILGENTQIVIDELWGNKKAEGTSISLIFGSIFNAIKEKLNINSKNEIKTPATIIGVRGTKYIAAYQESVGTQIAVLEGSVYAVPVGAEQEEEQAVLTPGSDAGDYGIDLTQIDKGLLEAIVISGAFSDADKELLKQVEKTLEKINATEKKAEEERLLAEKLEQEMAELNNEDTLQSDDEDNYTPPVTEGNDDEDKDGPEPPDEDEKYYEFEGSDIRVEPDKPVFWDEIKDRVKSSVSVPEEEQEKWEDLLKRCSVRFRNIRINNENTESIGLKNLPSYEKGTAVTVDIMLWKYSSAYKWLLVTIRDVGIIYGEADETVLPEEEPDVVQNIEIELDTDQSATEELEIIEQEAEE